MREIPEHWRCLFNHDGFCIYSNASRYQDIHEPVGLSQVYGYVDEVADAGCDVLLLCPNLYQLPGWDSDHYPFWRGEARNKDIPSDSAAGHVFRRARDFICAGNDLIQLSLDRAREKNIAFFLTWRMNECHCPDFGKNPGLSAFWHEHPEYRIGGQGAGKDMLNYAYPEVRDYQFGFIEELCTRYAIDGLELDFLRHEYFFPESTPYKDKSFILTEYVRRIRNMLDHHKIDIPICVRVPNDLSIMKHMGLDLKTCVDEGLADMINVSSHFITQPDGDIEGFRREFPNTRIYAELTHCMHRGHIIELSTEQTRKNTKEIYYAIAHSFLSRGADGISFFNFTYTRDYSFGHPLKLDRHEPDYEIIRNITNLNYLSRQNKHYFVGMNYASERWSRQFPAELSADHAVEIQIHIADETPKQDFSRSILRLCSDDNIESREIEVQCKGESLKGTAVLEELYPQPYQECIPEAHAQYKDYVVPLTLLEKGWNTFKICLANGPTVILHRVELALYKKWPCEVTTKHPSEISCCKDHASHDPYGKGSSLPLAQK